MERDAVFRSKRQVHMGSRPRQRGNALCCDGGSRRNLQGQSKWPARALFQSEEVHIRVLALDPKGNLIAGSDGSGLVYRIAPSGDAFVLYSAPKKEIIALAIDNAGNIYAAGAGEKRPGSTPPLSVAASSSTPSGPSPVGNLPTTTPTTPPTPFPAPGLSASGGSEIYRIAPDGAPSRLWNSHDDLVYALGFDEHGRLLAGTGNRGHIFAINGIDDYTDLNKASTTRNYLVRSCARRRALCFGQQSRESFPPGSKPGAGRHLRKRRI